VPEIDEQLEGIRLQLKRIADVLEGEKAKRAKQAALELDDRTPEVESFLLNDGTEFGVTARMVSEFESAYPGVDVDQTLKEIRAWSLANKLQRKTRGGALRFVNAWLAKEQNRAGLNGERR